MLGHASKGQHSGGRLLCGFKAGGSTLFDLEYLVDESGLRMATFSYWADYARAMVAMNCWIARQKGGLCDPIGACSDRAAAMTDLGTAPNSCADPSPSANFIGASGRVGSGAADLCAELRLKVTKWDMAKTASGGPIGEILQHDLFFNCILARTGAPIFVPAEAVNMPRNLRLIGDITFDPDSEYNPIPIYSTTTDWAAPALRVADTPVLDVMAIDNLPSLLPRESSEDFTAQLLPTLRNLDSLQQGVWRRAQMVFEQQVAEAQNDNSLV